MLGINYSRQYLHPAPCCSLPHQPINLSTTENQSNHLLPLFPYHNCWVLQKKSQAGNLCHHKFIKSLILTEIKYPIGNSSICLWTVTFSIPHSDQCLLPISGPTLYIPLLSQLFSPSKKKFDPTQFSNLHSSSNPSSSF